MKLTWCRAIGAKCSKDAAQSDFCCFIRSIWVFLHIAAIVAIIANAIHQW